MQARLLRNLLVTILLVALAPRKAPGQVLHRPSNFGHARQPVARSYLRPRQPMPHRLSRRDLAQFEQPLESESPQGEPTPASPAGGEPSEPSLAPKDASSPAEPAAPQQPPAAAEDQSDSAAPAAKPHELPAETQDLPEPEAADADQSPGAAEADADGKLQPLPMHDHLLSPGPPAPVCSSGCWLDSGLWYTQDEFVYVNRGGPAKERTLSFETQTNRADPALLRTSKSLGYSPGARFTLGTFLCRDGRNRDHAIEFTYFGFLGWEQSRGLFAPGNRIQSAIDPSAAGFSLADRQNYTYQSELQSFELNLRLNRRLGRDRLELNPKGYWVRKCSPAPLCSLIGGFRVISVDERFEYFSQGNPFGFDTSPTTRTNFENIRGSFQTSTRNDLVGLQAGTDIWFQHCKWRTGVRVKGGPYIDFSDQSTRVMGVRSGNVLTTTTTTMPNPEPGGPPIVTTTTTSDPFRSDIDRNEKASDNHAAFVGEVSIMGQYQVRRNLALRASYDLMWINQVALGLDQLSFVQREPADIAIGGNLFLQGFSLGAEYVW